MLGVGWNTLGVAEGEAQTVGDLGGVEDWESTTLGKEILFITN